MSAQRIIGWIVGVAGWICIWWAIGGAFYFLSWRGALIFGGGLLLSMAADIRFASRIAKKWPWQISSLQKMGSP